LQYASISSKGMHLSCVCTKDKTMKKQIPWDITLITPNYLEAKAECQLWVERGYGTQFSKFKKQVQIKKGGPNQALYIVRKRVKS